MGLGGSREDILACGERGANDTDPSRLRFVPGLNIIRTSAGRETARSLACIFTPESSRASKRERYTSRFSFGGKAFAANGERRERLFRAGDLRFLACEEIRFTRRADENERKRQRERERERERERKREKKRRWS